MATICYIYKADDVPIIKRYRDVPLFRLLSTSDAEVADEEKFEIVHINDYTNEQVKQEQHVYEETGDIAGVDVCAAYHGGPLDYPKVSSESLAKVTSKWDHCFINLEDSIASRKKKQSSQCRDTNSDEEVYEQLTGDSLKNGNFKFDKRDIQGASEEEEGFDRVPSEEDFHSSVSESASKVYLQNVKLCKDLLAKGEICSLLKVLGGLSLVRNKLWHYNEFMKLGGKTKAFREPYVEICQLIEGVSEQLMEYHCSLVGTTILHDAASHDWGDSRPFYEGEKISHSVQMWWYFLQGFKSDLWQSLPPKTAQRIFTGVFSNSFNILTVRYCKTSPNPGRVKQFQADIVAILLITIEVLTCICSSADKLFDTNHNSTCHTIHNQCNHLVASLAIVGCPLNVLASSVSDLKKSRSKHKRKHQMSDIEAKTAWMSFIRSDLFKPYVNHIPASSHIILLAKLTANQPEPCWPLVVQTVLSHDMNVAKLIMLHFGAFIPSNKPDQTVPPMTNGCHGFQCRKKCLGSADHHWPQVVGTAAMKLCIEGSRDPKVLVHLMEPFLKKLSKISWESINRTNLRNPRNPVCFAAISQVIEPYLNPVLNEFFARIESGKAWTSSHVPGTMKEVILNIHDIIPLIPAPILHLTTYIESIAPSGIRPLGNSVLTHCIIASMYNSLAGLIPTLKKYRLAKERLDFIIAFGEALCNLDPSPELETIQTLAKEVLSEEVEHGPLSEHSYDLISCDYSFSVAEMIANGMLADELGSLSLKSLYRFICYNVGWIQNCVDISSNDSAVSLESDGKTHVLIRPWGSEIFPPQSPYEMMNQIGAFCCADQAECLANDAANNGNGVVNEDTKFRLESIMKWHHKWEDYINHVLHHGSALLINDLMTQRSELRSEDEQRKLAVLDIQKKWKNLNHIKC